MALRNIVEIGDPVLNKKCRKIEKFDDKLSTLIDDMFETMYAGRYAQKSCCYRLW